MLGIERRQKILEKLQRDSKVYVADLSDAMRVTQETIRRDLEKLEAQGLLLRSHGGAVRVSPSNEDLSFANRTASNYDLKQAIARKAVGLVNDGSSLMVDSSSTVLALCGLLKNKKDLTIITNSIKLLNDCAASSLDLISSGGTLRAHSLALVGTAACRTLSNYNVDLAVFSCKGLDRDQGVTESNEPEGVVKQVMARQAKNRVLLADHTKFDVVVFAKTLDFADIDYVITDVEPSRKWVEFFKKNDIQLIC
ncbi:MAG: DeoR/GlpR family DNA-binding transcription regulator [Planctomycetaceae bacterium]|nr:DeoR/GlpR family DNA-binding transcription regulator [Planctomycetaceae bacterium]